MPVLSNPRHEAFATNLAAGLGQYDAYINAGFEGNPSAASQIAKRPEVKARVQELIEERQAVRREQDRDQDDSVSDLSRDWILKQLKQNIVEGQKTGQISAANKAVELMMDMLGFTKKSKAVKEDEEEKPETPGAPSVDKLGSVLDRIESMREVPADLEPEAETSEPEEDA